MQTRTNFFRVLPDFLRSPRPRFCEICGKKKKKKKEISPGMRKESRKNRARLRGLFYKNMKN